MKKRKIISVVLTVLFVCSMLAACGRSSNEAGKYIKWSGNQCNKQ